MVADQMPQPGFEPVFGVGPPLIGAEMRLGPEIARIGGRAPEIERD